MVKSNAIGGKKHKQYKKRRDTSSSTEKKQIILAETNQIYGLVKNRVGGKRIIVECSDNITRNVIIPGKFFKKIWMKPGDILLCDVDSENLDIESNCYVNHKYTNKDAIVLHKMGEIQFEVNEEASDAMPINICRKTSQMNVPTIPFNDSEESDETSNEDIKLSKPNVSSKSNQIGSKTIVALDEHMAKLSGKNTQDLFDLL